METNFSGTLVLPKQVKTVLPQMKPNEITILCRKATLTRKSAYSITFSQALHSNLCRFKYCTLYESRVTRKVLLCFNNEKGFPVGKRKDKDNVVVYGKEIVQAICTYIQHKKEEPFRWNISSDLYQGEEFATFEIIK